MISSKYTIREQNESLILQKIITEHEISRVQLAKITKLNKASVSSITKKLLEDHLILETRIGNSSNLGGRKPIMLTFNKQTALFIGIDIGTDYIEGIVSYIDGTILAKEKKKKISTISHNIIENIQILVSTLTKKIPKTDYGISGMTVAIHGIVVENDILFTPNYSLDKIALHYELEALYDFPICLENEANLAALGEFAYSSKLDNLVFINIHNGIGAGIVEDGILMKGNHGTAGELGHTILFPDGLSCPCGNNGCLEQYVSREKLYTYISRELELDYVDSDSIARLYQEGNQKIISILNNQTRYLSIGINNIIAIHDPEIIFINNDVYKKIPFLMEQLSEYLSSRFSEPVIVKISSLDDNAILLGAIVNSGQFFLNIQNLKFLS